MSANAKFRWFLLAPITFLLTLSFLFLFCGSVFGDDFTDG